MRSESGSRILELKYKLATIELLNLAKNYYTYRELSQIVGLPETVLSRYIKGHVLPTIKRAESINSLLQNVLRLDAELEKRIVFDDSGYFDNTEIISDTLLLGRAVQYGINKFAGKRITKVLTAAVDGVPLATLLAYRLGVGLIIAKKEREVGVRDFIEETFIPQKTAVMMSLYIPKGSIRRGDCALIVDDIIDSGETQKALIKLIQKAKAEVTGVYALIGIGDEWKNKIAEVANCPMEVVLQIPRKKT